MGLVQHEIVKGRTTPCELVRHNKTTYTVICVGTRTYCKRVLDAIRSIGVKPRIYWTYYPKSKRGYWRVSAQPKLRTQNTLDLWTYAYNMAREMNNHQGTEHGTRQHT